MTQPHSLTVLPTIILLLRLLAGATRRQKREQPKLLPTLVHLQITELGRRRVEGELEG